MNHSYQTTIGLEVHVQLGTKSKLFCACNNDSEGAEPNTNICPICCGLVGTLPKMNKQALEWSIRTTLALNGKIADEAVWDRKSYFYPDLPKGYQLSQYDHPICDGGYVDIFVDGQEKRIELTRMHLEEDAGKLVHPPHSDYSLGDMNRAGTPLMEIVTEPVLTSAQEAKEFLKELQRIVRYLGVSSADMEKGHLRCDASISLKPHSQSELNPRIEIKNLNSFRAVEKALEYQQKEYAKLLDAGTPPENDVTAGWIDDKEITKTLRSKEGSTDYRYFPDPDIPTIIVTSEMRTEQEQHLTLLPANRKKQYLEYGLQDSEADILIKHRHISDFYNDCDNYLKDKENAESLRKDLTNWVLREVMEYCENNAEQLPKPEEFAQLIQDIDAKEITRIVAVEIFTEMIKGKSYETVKQSKADEKGSIDLESILAKVIAENKTSIEDYKNGKEKALNVLIGTVMKETKGAINPGDVVKEIKKRI